MKVRLYLWCPQSWMRLYPFLTAIMVMFDGARDGDSSCGKKHPRKNWD